MQSAGEREQKWIKKKCIIFWMKNGCWKWKWYRFLFLLRSFFFVIYIHSLHRRNKWIDTSIHVHCNVKKILLFDRNESKDSKRFFRFWKFTIHSLIVPLMSSILIRFYLFFFFFFMQSFFELRIKFICDIKTHTKNMKNEMNKKILYR